MNKANLWNTVLTEIFAAVVTIGLRQNTFVRDQVSLYLENGGGRRNWKLQRQKKDIASPAS